jgi:hypothetical protein
MAYQSLWWLAGHDEPEFLRISGYPEFPAVVGRWRVFGNDIYGRKHPGETALDDAIAIQLLERDSRGAIERTVTPPILIPAGFDGKLDLRPGKPTRYDGVAGGTPGILPMYNVKFDYAAAEMKIQQLESHIERAFYVDLFRMWTSFRRQGITATQVQAEDSEKSYILAPVTMRQTSEVLDRVIILVWNTLDRAGLFPPPPPELQREPIRIEYVSEFAMLQKRAQQTGIENLITFAGQLASLQSAAGRPPEILDRIDADETIEVISDMYGIKSGIILGDDAVAELREQRAEDMRRAQAAQLAAQAAELAPKAAAAAKDMSETPAGETSALDAFTAAMNGDGQA